MRGVPAWLKRQAYAEYGITQLLENAGLDDTLCVDGREIPIESILRAIREEFLKKRAKRFNTGAEQPNSCRSVQKNNRRGE